MKGGTLQDQKNCSARPCKAANEIHDALRPRGLRYLPGFTLLLELCSTGCAVVMHWLLLICSGPFVRCFLCHFCFNATHVLETLTCAILLFIGTSKNHIYRKHSLCYNLFIESTTLSMNLFDHVLASSAVSSYLAASLYVLFSPNVSFFPPIRNRFKLWRPARRSNFYRYPSIRRFWLELRYFIAKVALLGHSHILAPPPPTARPSYFPHFIQPHLQLFVPSHTIYSTRAPARPPPPSRPGIAYTFNTGSRSLPLSRSSFSTKAPTRFTHLRHFIGTRLLFIPGAYQSSPSLPFLYSSATFKRQINTHSQFFLTDAWMLSTQTTPRPTPQALQ